MKLRFRVIAAFFLVALPGAAGAVAAVGLFDRVIREEIALRASEVLDETRRVLLDEQRELARMVAAAADRDPLLEALAEAPEEAALAGRAADWALAEAAALPVDLLAVTLGRGARAELASSAHLSMAVGDPPPRFATRLAPGETRTGFALELVEGNPPERVPALVAVHAPEALEGRVVIYGGRRLDHRLLGRLARMANARIALEVPGRAPEVFPKAQPRFEGSSDRIPLSRLRGEPRARVKVSVDVTRLWVARGQFLWLSGVLLAGALSSAVIAGVWLSARITRPIVALARAAERVGRGDLEVRVAARSSDEVGALVRVFNEMTVELQKAQIRIQRAERVAAWREVARRLAHEIKNPLSPMRLGMQNLRKAWRKAHPQLGEILEESTRSVLDEVAALDRLVTDFSSFARLPAPDLRPVAPLELLEGAARLYDGRVTLERDVVAGRDLPAVAADPELLGRALVNLVKNAVEATADRPSAHITLDARAARRAGRAGVELEVADEGPGMTAAQIEDARRVYSTTKAGGSGLGLAITERTVEEHGGVLVLDSAPERGTRARMWIPTFEDRPPG
jgi:signal transduction histidine kinase